MRDEPFCPSLAGSGRPFVPEELITLRSVVQIDPRYHFFLSLILLAEDGGGAPFKDMVSHHR